MITWTDPDRERDRDLFWPVFFFLVLPLFAWAHYENRPLPERAPSIDPVAAYYGEPRDTVYPARVCCRVITYGGTR